MFMTEQGAGSDVSATEVTAERQDDGSWRIHGDKSVSYTHLDVYKRQVYRLSGSQVPTYFPALWDREMSTGAYLPRWINCSTEDGPVRALVFIMNRDNPAYIRALPDAELLAIVRRAAGRYGPCTCLLYTSRLRQR